MNYQLLVGDAIQEMETLNIVNSAEDGWCDLIITSPPYNLGIEYADGVNDKMAEEDYDHFSKLWLREALIATKPTGHLFLNVGSVPRARQRPFQVLAAAVEMGWVLQNTFHWIKSISFQDKAKEWVSRGQFSPINSTRYVNDLTEYVFHLTPCGQSPLDKLAVGVPFQDKTNVERWAGKVDRRCRGNVWLLPYQTINSCAKQRPHPATYPVELVEMCIKIAGCPRTMMDPFVGSGTSAIAARRCGVEEFFGFDLSETYITSALQRLAAEELLDTL